MSNSIYETEVIPLKPFMEVQVFTKYPESPAMTSAEVRPSENAQ